MLVMRAKCVQKFQFHERKKNYFLFVKLKFAFFSHFVQSFIISYHRYFNLCVCDC